jgi:hypothetical protein
MQTLAAAAKFGVSSKSSAVGSDLGLHPSGTRDASVKAIHGTGSAAGMCGNPCYEFDVATRFTLLSTWCALPCPALVLILRLFGVNPACLMSSSLRTGDLTLHKIRDAPVNVGALALLITDLSGCVHPKPEWALLHLAKNKKYYRVKMKSTGIKYVVVAHSC